jgi:hypothetical protein
MGKTDKSHQKEPCNTGFSTDSHIVEKVRARKGGTRRIQQPRRVIILMLKQPHISYVA